MESILTENTQFCIKGNGLLGLEHKFPSATQLGTAAQPQNKPSKHIWSMPETVADVIAHTTETWKQDLVRTLY